MPHVIDFDGLERNLFILQHVSYGSPQFCNSIKLTRDCYGGDYEWWQYTGLLKSFVSNVTIASAIKVRMLLDVIKSDSQEINLKLLDSQVREGISIGYYIEDNRDVSLRDSCNKIVHAKDAILLWVDGDDEAENPPIEYWNGKYLLSGVYNREKWQMELCIPSWCTAMIRFNKEIQELVDWGRVFKNDE